ncbi:transglycosylase SLT domain-containing protein [uncultured Roseovarius sp.]|uniref:transglycosylase SLT domain-containing protein n=1 Tax=uncultured Roseovarius sp. TaxID=293344 RepID=UPI002636CDCE|nr:transglycosylase SLT domain-containing protein [uncultured Roseovarius sp.]
MTVRAISTLASKMQAFRKSKFWLPSFDSIKVCRLVVCFTILGSVFVANASFARSETGNICDQVARKASAESGVPFSVLWSITRTETGRSRNGKLRPWPWTVNMEGAGHWFDTQDAARAFVFKHFKRGARSFDIGCFQINYKWHGASFRSIEHMFDPLENARYAAAFLQRLYRESGDWSVAVGAYHSRTPEYAKRYVARFDRIRKQHKHAADIAASSPSQPREFATAAREPRENNYPLLMHSGSAKSNGSLVPLPQGQAKALFSISGILEGS